MIYELLSTVILPWIITVSFILLIGICVIKLPSLIKAVFAFPPRMLFIFFIIICTGFYVRMYVVPHYHRIYYDEDRYLSYAVTFAKFGKATNINFATPQKVVKGTPELVARLTVPTLNAWVLRMWGYTEENLYKTATILSGVQIILMGIASYLLFKNKLVTFFSMFLMAFIPVNVYWAVSTNLDAYFVFFSLFAFVATLLYAKKPHIIHTIFLSVTTLLLLYVRFEAMLFLPVMGIALFIIRKQERIPFVQKRELTAFLFLGCIIVLRVLMSYSILGKTWCCGESTPLEVFGSEYFFRNLLPNLLSLFTRIEFPFIFTVFALYAVFGISDLRIVPLIVWILAYFFIYSFYFAGLFFTYQFSGSYGRYFLMLIPPFIILISLTANEIYKRIHNKKKLRILIATTVCILLLPTLLNYHQLITTSPWYSAIEKAPRENHYFLEHDILPITPKNSIYIHPLTAVVLLHNRTAIYLPSFQIDDEIISYVVSELKKGTPVYLFSPGTCYAFPDQCKKFEKYVDVKPVTNPKTKVTYGDFALLTYLEATHSSSLKK